ncbi:MAG: hypothetical protein HRT57_02560, partial [Crocinitomicaceae bacterium]|nr:hypothetical protein [Crocinitomicaceae bacterium]
MSEKIKYLLISLVIASAFVLGNKAAADEVASEDVTIEEATVVSSSSDNDSVMGNIVSVAVNDDVTVSVGGVTPLTQPTCSGGNTWSVVGLDMSTAPEGNLAIVIDHADLAGNNTQITSVV